MTKDTKASEFTESTSVLYTDNAPFISDPSGNPRNRRAPINSFFAGQDIRVAANDAPANWKKHADYVCTGSADDVDLLAAIAALPTAGGKLHLSPGTFNADNAIVIPDHIHLISSPGTVLKACASMTYVLGNATASYPNQHLVIEDLVIDANDLATYGLYLNHISAACEVSRVKVHNAVSHGVYAYICMILNMTNVYSYSNGGCGFYLEGNSASNYSNLRAVSNVSHGIQILSATGYGGNCWLFGCSSETNEGNQLYVYNCYNPVVILGFHAEQYDANTNDPVLLDESIGILMGGRISGYGWGTNYCVHITGSTRSAWYVAANKLARNGTSDGSVITVKDDGNQESFIGTQWGGTPAPIPWDYTGVTESVADGDSITHGMGAAPTKVFTQASVAGEIATPSGITSTKFDVDIKKHDGSAGTTQTIYWRAVR